MGSCATDNPNAFTLPAVLDLGAAHALRDNLLEASSELEGIVVDAEQVERIGTPAVQVLLAAARTLSADGRAFALRKSSPAVCSAFEDLGLIDELKRWGDI